MELRERLAALENLMTQPTQRHQFRILDRLDVLVIPSGEKYTSAFMLMSEGDRQVLFWLGPGDGRKEFMLGSHFANAAMDVRYDDDDLVLFLEQALVKLAEEEAKPRRPQALVEIPS